MSETQHEGISISEFPIEINATACCDTPGCHWSKSGKLMMVIEIWNSNSGAQVFTHLDMMQSSLDGDCMNHHGPWDKPKTSDGHGTFDIKIGSENIGRMSVQSSMSQCTLNENVARDIAIKHGFVD